MLYKCLVFTGLGLRGIPSVLCDLIGLSHWAAGVIVSGALWDGMLETCIQSPGAAFYWPECQDKHYLHVQ